MRAAVGVKAAAAEPAPTKAKPRARASKPGGKAPAQTAKVSMPIQEPSSRPPSLIVCLTSVDLVAAASALCLAMLRHQKKQTPVRQRTQHP
jgi:hypothetical protein